MTVFTIGFTKTSAADFFGRLTDAGVKTIVDVRLNNTSQLAGFAKAADLEYFLQAIGRHRLPARAGMLAPTQEIIDGWRKEKRPWEEFEARFKGLMAEREIEAAPDARSCSKAPACCAARTSRITATGGWCWNISKTGGARRSTYGICRVLKTLSCMLVEG